MSDTRFTLNAQLSGQRLSISLPLTVSGTVNYLDVVARGNDSWDDCTVTCYLQNENGDVTRLGLQYSYDVEGYVYPSDNRYTLSAGQWSVWFSGVRTAGNVVTYRIVSEIKNFTVKANDFYSTSETNPPQLSEQAYALANTAYRLANGLDNAWKSGELTGEQGVPGVPAEIGEVTATVDDNVGTPSCDVTVTKDPDEENSYDMNFDFKNLKGERGYRGYKAVIDDVGVTVSQNTGTASASATVTETQGNNNYRIDFEFSGIKGETGETIDDYVLVQPTQPTSSTNKIWVDSDDTPITLPTPEDFDYYDIVQNFDTNKNYNAGNYVTHEGDVYVFNVNHSAGDWDSTEVTQTVLGNEVSNLKSALDKYDNPFETTIDAYTNGIVKICIIASDVANFTQYRIRVIRKNITWHWYMTLQGYNGESWVNVDDVESAYIDGATYPRVETIVSKYNKYTVTLDWNYVRAEDISASGLEIAVKNSIVYKPFSDALANIKTNQANITTLTANQQRYNSIFAVTVPDSILGLADISIYNPNVSNYEKYRVRNVRHNSSWHFQLTLQGYANGSWTNVDEVEITIASAPSPVPAVEVYDSNYHRFYVTIVWAMMGESITLTAQDYTLKNSVVNKTQIKLRQDVNRALTGMTIPPFELADHVDRTKVIKVKKDGTGDYTTIGAAYAAITDSAFDNQYEIVVYPGTYNENNLQPPAYTHTHGIFPLQTIVDSTGSEDVDNSVFDQGHAPSKLSNLYIKSATKYCVHQDVELYGVTIVNENLYCEKLPGGSQLNSACIGIGADFGGAKFVWRGCTFVNGEVGAHTNPNQDPNANQHIIYENCSFINAFVWLGVAGNTYGEYVCEIKGCKTNKGNAGMRLKFGTAISGIPVNFPWQVIGGNNNLAPMFDNTSDTSVSDDWDAISTTEKVYFIASESITKGKFVTISGEVADDSTELSEIAGIALKSGSSGDKLPAWNGPIPYTGDSGEYGIDASGELSASATIKTGRLYNNIYYPYMH